MSERFVEADGVRMFVRERGEGAPVILLHGFPQTGRCWDAVAEALSARRRVIVPDLPGFGRSAAPPAHDAGTISRILQAFMDAVGAPRASVVGHDWGGSFALRLALDAPERVARLAVTNAPFRKVDPLRMWYVAAFNVPVVPELVFAAAGDRLVPWFIRLGAARKDALPDAALREYGAAYRSASRARDSLGYYRTITRTALLRALQRRTPPPDEAKRPRRITVPTLLLWGMKDPALPRHLLDGVEKDIAEVTIIELPDAGHFTPEEAPDELARALDAFLP